MSRRPKTGDDREAEWLQARGFDGLYHPESSMECGCFIGDLRPCGDIDTVCRGGHAINGGIFRPQRRRRDE